MNKSRIDRLVNSLSTHDLDCAVVIPGSTMVYLTDLHFHLMERPTVAFFQKEGKPALVIPDFECSKLESPDDWQVFPWRDDEGVDGAFEACCQALNLSEKRVGVEELGLRYKEYALLQKHASGASIGLVDPIIAAMRSTKDADEVERMRSAVVMTETVLQNALPQIKIGMTEKEVAALLTMGFFTAGSETLPFEPLVQTGLTGATPHASAGDRKLASGDLLIIDFGGRKGGYVSDITRTFAVGEISDEARRMHDLVRAANQAGREAAGPGVECQAVDRAARKVIDKAGYGQYFTHRTGHGVGLEGHEPPYIVEGNDLILQPGHTFTVEPGIYVAGVGGVRIEDNVVITENGAESLSTFSREIISVG